MDNLSFFEVTGFSMWPFLKTNERIVVKKDPIEKLRIGDIILYRSDTKIVCHRLIKKIKVEKDYLLYTRGDNSRSLSKLPDKRAYLGRVKGVLKKNGKTVNFISNGYYFINCIIIFLGPMISVGARKIRPYYKLLYKLITSRKRSS